MFGRLLMVVVLLVASLACVPDAEAHNGRGNFGRFGRFNGVGRVGYIPSARINFNIGGGYGGGGGFAAPRYVFIPSGNVGYIPASNFGYGVPAGNIGYGGGGFNSTILLQSSGGGCYGGF